MVELNQREGQEKDSKKTKFVVGDDTPSVHHSSTPPSPATLKKPMRHHVKRRSTSRVHVTKLAPISRLNVAHTDSEADFEPDEPRPAMRRSQSQRSLRRLPFDKKSLATLTPYSAPKANVKPKAPGYEDYSTSLPLERKELEDVQKTSHRTNPIVLSHMTLAAPVEQIFNAVSTLVVKSQSSPVNQDISKPLPERQEPLRSQFVAHRDTHGPARTKPHSNHARPTITRTQQKLLLQRQQCMEEEKCLVSPCHHQKLSSEVERVGREYQCIRRHQDPLTESILRCLERRTLVTKRNHKSGEPVSRAMATPLSETRIHVDHRQPYRHPHLRTIAEIRAQNSINTSSSTPNVFGVRWNTGSDTLDWVLHVFSHGNDA